MNWQEYQEAVACFYEQLEGNGIVKRNIFLPDKITGQRRQIDVLLEITTKGHSLRIMIDAKFYKEKLDVRDIEGVLALANAVGVSQVAIVAANGWTEPAEKRANFDNCILRLLTLEKALDLLVPDKWKMCPNCNNDCIVLDMDGVTEYDYGLLWWIAGKCRACNYGLVWCQDCGENFELPFNEEVFCECGHAWHFASEGLFIRFNQEIEM